MKNLLYEGILYLLPCIFPYDNYTLQRKYAYKIFKVVFKKQCL